MQLDEFIIRNAIIHILDSTVGMPVLSDTILDLSPDLNDFLREHIYKIASSDEIKKCQFDKEESFVYKRLEHFDENNLIEMSKEIAQYLYTIMNQNIEIPPADVIMVTYQIESTMYFAILKMNYKETYVHLTGQNESYGNYNDIIKQTATLPASGAKLTEAVLINLKDYSLQVIEKKYDINGVKTNYFTDLFLQCKGKMSSKSQLSIITKAVDQINKKYFEHEFDKQMEVKSVIQNEMEEKGSIMIETLGEKMFGDIPEIKEEFIDKIEKYNLQKEEIRPQNKLTTKKFEKQFLTTDTGIEINIPMEEYNNKKNIEFITNPDATISVLIKNINYIKSK